MMTKSIRNRMYKNIAMLVFLMITAIAITFVNKAKAVDVSTDKDQVIQVSPESK